MIILPDFHFCPQLVMLRATLVLVGLACIGDSRREHAMAEIAMAVHLRSQAFAERHRSPRVTKKKQEKRKSDLIQLVGILALNNPVAAFQPLCSGVAHISASLQDEEYRVLSLMQQPIASRAQPAQFSSTKSHPFFFDPLQVFLLDESERPPSHKLPLLIVLPGLDGTGITAWMQYPELSLAYEIKAMRFPADDRSDFEAVVDMVADEVAIAKSEGREVYVLGESMGASIALHVAVRRDLAASPNGLVLVSPAMGWDRTWLGRSRNVLIKLPDALLNLVTLLTSYQLLDLEQLCTTLRRVVTGERSPILDTPGRLEYALRVVKAMPEAFAQPASALRHRIAEFVEPSLAIGREISELNLPPMLVVAGTADLRVPAEEEAFSIQAAAQGACDVHLVPSAGHAGVTDDRVNLRQLMDDWRRKRISEPGAQAS